MSITASKIGNSGILADWSHIGTSFTGKDPSPSWKELKDRFDTHEVAFYNAPASDQISQIDSSIKTAKEILNEGFEDCLFLGIGGSALGPISILSALNFKRKNSIRFHFKENPDPHDWKTTIQNLNPDKTLICCVTKSGGTFETMAQFMLALEWLGRSRWKKNVLLITDPKNGDLRRFANEQGVRSLAIHPGMGGRFSIFSPVGFFPIELAGLSSRSFIEGAQSVREYIEKSPPEKNAVFLIGQALLNLYSTHPVHVCMPYSTQLRLLGDWWVQLWGESLGKDGKGFTPIAAVGATDQHSLLQLLRDGPNDKVTLFIRVESASDPVQIPEIDLPVQEQLPVFTLLKGHSLFKLLDTEYEATSRVLTRGGRPNFTLQIEKLDEKALGALYFFFSALTAFTGTAWGINPFDQPGVEEGKIYIKEALRAQSGASTQEHPSAADRLRPQ